MEMRYWVGVGRGDGEDYIWCVNVRWIGEERGLDD